MLAYIIRRLLFMIPTIFGIMLVSFVIVQFAPGGPVERMIASCRGSTAAPPRFRRGGTWRPRAQRRRRRFLTLSRRTRPRPEIHRRTRKAVRLRQAGLRALFLLVRNYLTFDFGRSYFRDVSVLQLIKEKLPVSISLGLWMTVLSYAISIPLGIRKAMLAGSPFDAWTSGVIVIGYAIPSFLFAILLIVLFAGGSFWQIFPLRGLTSDNWASLSLFGKIGDYLWHITLPVTALTLGAFAQTTFLTKNSFLEEIKKQYVMTARMKGLSERRVLYGHVFRNAMMIVISGFPGAFIMAFFSGSLLIERMFNLDGLGLLTFDSLINRDYPVVFANLYIFALLGLVITLISDLAYVWIDPRIDFETREV